jgi:hypothetical protein
MRFWEGQVITVPDAWNVTIEQPWTVDYFASGTECEADENGSSLSNVNNF